MTEKLHCGSCFVVLIIWWSLQIIFTDKWTSPKFTAIITLKYQVSDMYVCVEVWTQMAFFEFSMCITQGILYCMYHSWQLCHVLIANTLLFRKSNFVSNLHGLCSYLLKHLFSSVSSFFCNLLENIAIRYCQMFVFFQYITLSWILMALSQMPTMFRQNYLLLWNFKLQIKWN